MPQINSLVFKKIKSELLDGKCAHDQSYDKVYKKVSRRGPSQDEHSSTQGSTLTEDKLTQWKHFSIDDGYLIHKRKVCVPTNRDTRHQFYVCHDSPSTDHLGIHKTYALVRR